MSDFLGDVAANMPLSILTLVLYRIALYVTGYTVVRRPRGKHEEKR